MLATILPNNLIASSPTEAAAISLKYAAAYPFPPRHDHQLIFIIQQAQQQLTQHQSSYYDNRPPSSHSPSNYPSHRAPYAPATGPGAYADSRDYNYYEDEKKHKKDHSTEKGIGATLVGGGAGAFLGHELGGGALGTVGGMIAGAVGANALERRHEKYVILPCSF